MSSAPKQPCAPPLNLVPNGSAGSSMPPPLDSSIIPITDTNPGFGDLVTLLLDDAADPADGFDAAVAATSASIDALGVLLDAQDADLDAILSILAAADPSQSDGALTDYSNSFAGGNAIEGATAALDVPDLLLLPLGVGLGGAIEGPPTQTTINLGTVTQGSAPFTHEIGPWAQTRSVPRGLWNVTLGFGDPRIFEVKQTGSVDARGDGSGDYLLLVDPAVAGTWEAQITSTGGATGSQIISYTVTVAPAP